MRDTITLKPARVASAEAVDCDNPVWAEERLGSAIVCKGRKPLKAPTTSFTSMRFGPEGLACPESRDAGYRIGITQVLKKFVAGRPTRRSTGRALAWREHDIRRADRLLSFRPSVDCSRRFPRKQMTCAAAYRLAVNSGAQ